MRKTKKEIIYEDVEIIDAAAEGMSIAKVEGDEPGSGMVVFVPFVVPGDVIDLKVFKKKKNYAEGRAIAIKKPSPKRAELQCPHFGTCGGCKWQNMKYEDQIFYKQKQVKDNLERLGHVDCSTMRPVCGSENIFYYRNKLEYTFSTKRWRTNEEMDAISKEELAKDPGALGFHAPQLFDKVLNIDHCALQKDPSNAIRLAVRDYALENKIPFYDIRNHTGFLRNIVIRNSSIGEWMVVVIVSTGQDQNDTILGDDDRQRLFPLLDLLKERFPEITSLQYIVNNKFNDSYTDLDVVTYHGKDHIVEEMEGYKGGKTLRFKINPKSFFQTNSAQAQRLYSFVAEFADLQGDETVYDLYTGTGTIALFLAGKCKKIVGIEYVEEAIEDAKINAQYNGYDNTTFYAGDMAKVLTEDFIKENGRPDVVITDPPRAGMHEKVVEQLLATEARKIVYVSCNPATQARDLELLSSKYEVVKIQPVDMFPHTQHVENVVELKLK
ncbi:MAG: 23S rRNA (uracil(1939)-C(5))-methyltransferase RlmD [Bacteroidales bacterium]|nr:23S rRNA (uracil(1939)-C(5))-methyltransferase RlmD [Bacteroidales bacterium]